MAPDGISVEGQTAVVIGGTSGIGLAIAKAFARGGADVVASSRSEESVAEAAAELRELGAETVEVTCDVTDPDSLRHLRESVEDALGGVDTLVTSQGSVATTPVTEMGDAEWSRDIDVLLTGAFRAIREFGAAVDEGSIVNVSSVSARQSREARPSYTGRQRACPKNNFHANFTALEPVIDFIKQIFRQNRRFSDRLYRAPETPNYDARDRIRTG